MISPLELIASARKLVTGSGEAGPTQSDLRRSISAAYYALFHTLARTSADLLVGSPASAAANAAWALVYRNLDHASARRACLNVDMLRLFPQPVVTFAEIFARMQAARHRADYDPAASYRLSAVLENLGDCEGAILGFLDVSEPDRRAFCAFVLFRTRPG